MRGNVAARHTFKSDEGREGKKADMQGELETHTDRHEPCQDRPSPSEERRRAQRQKRIGAGLQRIYQDLLDQPTPEDLSRLLERADRRRTIAEDR